jgi:hypothetical protein
VARSTEYPLICNDNYVEAGSGIEPLYEDLQSSA